MTAEASEAADVPSDSELINAVRNGNDKAYEQLYSRHLDAARRMARQITKVRADAEDLVHEAFTRVLDALRSEKGPDAAFRAYLLTTLRNTARDRAQRDRKVHPVDDMETVPRVPVVEFDDTVIKQLEQSLAAKAFARLPEQWQSVLWHLEVEGQTPGQIASVLGIKPNAVSALAYRARERLRREYLQVHASALDDDAEECRATVDKLAAYIRGGLSERNKVRIDEHLDDCGQCQVLVAELAEINTAIPVFIAPLVLGGPTIAAGYIAATGGPAVVASAGAGATSVAAGVAGEAASTTIRNSLIGAAAAASLAALILALIPSVQPPATALPPAPLPAPQITLPAVQLPPVTKPLKLTPAQLQAPVEIPPPPDALHLAMSVIDAGWGAADNQIQFTVTNVSNRSGTGQAIVTLPHGVHAGYGVPGCDYRRNDLNPWSCTRYLEPGCDYWAYDVHHLRCTGFLDPGESFTRTIWLGATPDSLLTDPDTSSDYIRKVTIPITASINDYRQTTYAITRLWYPWQPLAKPVQGVKSAAIPPQERGEQYPPAPTSSPPPNTEPEPPWWSTLPPGRNGD